MQNLESAETPVLVDILRNYKDYAEEDVKHAYRLLEARGVIQQVIAQLKKEVDQGKIKIESQDAGHEPFRDFNPSNPVVMRTGSTNQMVFEQKLNEEGIPFHRQEGFDVIVPLVNYFFNDADRARADELEIETNNYVNDLPPDQRGKTTKTALKAVGWIIFFFAVFLLITYLFKLLQ
jgi:hypothetical protein